eukprot:6491976-Amphidinium_carterae.3
MVALEKLNRKLHWMASFLCLESIDTPLEMRPNRIVAFRDFDNKIVWPTLRKPRIKRIKANIVSPIVPLPDAGEQTVLGALDDGEDDHEDDEEYALDEGPDEELEDDSQPEITELFNKVDIIQALHDLEAEHNKQKKVQVGECLSAAASTDTPMASLGEPANTQLVTQAQPTSMSSQVTSPTSRQSNQRTRQAEQKLQPVFPLGQDQSHIMRKRVSLKLDAPSMLAVF